MSTPVGNSSANAPDNGPTAGYSLKHQLFILFMLIFVISMNTCICDASLIKVIEILHIYTFNFGIKIYRKLPRFLTVFARYSQALQFQSPLGPSGVTILVHQSPSVNIIQHFLTLDSTISESYVNITNRFIQHCSQVRYLFMPCSPHPDFPTFDTYFNIFLRLIQRGLYPDSIF